MASMNPEEITTEVDFICMDCGVNTIEIREYYMVNHELWHTAHPEHDGMLCIGCLESRIGRRLTPADFLHRPINWIFERSERLNARLVPEENR